jgi:nitroimidazol reductase NimA-like FMN-containing flavoprotein (pyridoxamine 5'-phosphate oxidase superfamily)
MSKLGLFHVPEARHVAAMTQREHPLQRTPRTAVHRMPARASYDRDLAYRIIDEALFCSVGFVIDGQPYVLPMVHARIGDEVVLHGAVASRLLAACAAAPLCLSFTLVDGVVLARSAMHHSMNYRSVAILGCARELADRGAKLAALHALVDHVLRGRSRDVRPPNAKELTATKVLAVPIEEASVKVREGRPIDDELDLDWPCWAGVVPLGLAAAPPQPSAQRVPDVTAPEAVLRYRR